MSKEEESNTQEENDMLAIRNTNNIDKKVDKRDLKAALKKGNKKYKNALDKLAK